MYIIRIIREVMKAASAHVIVYIFSVPAVKSMDAAINPFLLNFLYKATMAIVIKMLFNTFEAANVESPETRETIAIKLGYPTGQTANNTSSASPNRPVPGTKKPYPDRSLSEALNNVL